MFALPGQRGIPQRNAAMALGKQRSICSSTAQAAVLAAVQLQVLAEAFLMDLRDIFEYLALTDRFSLRSSSRLHAELPIRCEMTWNYKFDPVPMPCRPYSNLRKRQVTENNARCNNQVVVWDGRCVDCRKFACVWHSTRITLDRFRRVNLCMPCQVARGMFR